ncbi:MAG: methylase involved in ubiquinone/menaquinone biosynthesis [Candidatus Brocadiaceae bacterium]|nr:methylase involved in ubiquinone/menaquinone biosynthesis [Candidatus Brocadiaceae bacterium]
MINFGKIAHTFSNYNRRRKYDLFCKTFNPNSQIKILDVGASEKEYQENANILEKQYPYPENITVLGVDDYNEFHSRYPKVKTVVYNGNRHFPFADKEFDICWSNAVIEHVGNKNEQRLFLKEIQRVAKASFITTPNKYFPVEVHTRTLLLHFLLPKTIFDKFLSFIDKKWATGSYMYLLSLNDIKKLLHEAGISNYKIIKSKLFFFTLDFIIIF